MPVVNGFYNNAEVLQDSIETKLEQQIQNMLKNRCFRRSNIYFMPDTHPGKFFPVGLYGEFYFEDGIMPSLIGNDAGCGITAVKINIPKKKFSFDKLDKVIKNNIPTGHSNRIFIPDETCDHLLSYLNANVDEETVWKSYATLGSGNHYIEIDQDTNGDYWLIVHSGSRYLGNAILEYWLNWCKKYNTPEVYELGVINDSERVSDYIYDTKIARKFADYNRYQIIKIISKESGIEIDTDYTINSSHNHITSDTIDDHEIAIIRKGVSHSFSPIPISINPAEGHLLVLPTSVDYRHSLPHGSGRAIMRKEVANFHTVSEYKKDMRNANIHCNTITKDNLDECPKAYRNKEYLENAINNYSLGNIIDYWKPVYVYKPKE